MGSPQTKYLQRRSGPGWYSRSGCKGSSGYSCRGVIDVVMDVGVGVLVHVIRS